MLYFNLFLSVTRLRAKIMERMQCQDLKVQIVRDMNIEKYLLCQIPRQIISRRTTVAASAANQIAPVKPATKISLAKPIKNIPFGARGRKRVSLDVIPSGLNSGLEQVINHTIMPF